MHLSRVIVALVLLPVGVVSYLAWMAYAGPKELTRVEKVEVYLQEEKAKLPALVKSGPKPHAVCEERVFDFGVMQPGDSREREFATRHGCAVAGRSERVLELGQPHRTLCRVRHLNEHVGRRRTGGGRGTPIAPPDRQSGLERTDPGGGRAYRPGSRRWT